jgi:hypothetical protein
VLRADLKNKNLTLRVRFLAVGVDGLASLNRLGIFTAKNLLCCAERLFNFLSTYQSKL